MNNLVDFLRTTWVGGLLVLAPIYLLVLPSATAAVPEIADSPPPADSAAASDFIIGNTIFVMAHEFAHAIIRDFDVPILGLEENSADTLAAVVLIFAEHRNAATSPEPGRFSRALGMAAVGNLLTWRSGLEAGNPELVYWAQHDLSARRAARILCLLVGSDPEGFGWLVDAGTVPEVRAENCPDEYALAAHAVEWVGRTYGRFRDGQGVDEGREITIRYFAPATPAQAALLKRLKDAQVAEKVAAYYDRAFRFPEPLGVRFVSCGVPNAYWDPDARQLRFCYEILESMEKQSVDPAVARAYDLLRGREKISSRKARSAPPGVIP